jgi:hypothetical protein
MRDDDAIWHFLTWYIDEDNVLWVICRREALLPHNQSGMGYYQQGELLVGRYTEAHYRDHGRARYRDDAVVIFRSWDKLNDGIGGRVVEPAAATLRDLLREQHLRRWADVYANHESRVIAQCNSDYPQDGP